MEEINDLIESKSIEALHQIAKSYLELVNNKPLGDISSKQAACQLAHQGQAGYCDTNGGWHEQH